MIVSADHHCVNEDNENGEASDYLCSSLNMKMDRLR